jgi:phosphoribosylglycinamide formyltransferase 1
VVRPKDFESVDAFSAAVFARVEERGAGLVCLAGFMVRLGIPKKWHDRVMNVHPALLPAFGGQGMYGHFVHDSVLTRGAKITGATVHFVDCEYDHGPIVLQKAVEVREDDDRQALADRVQAAEREIYPEAVRLFAAGRLVVAGKRVRIIPEGRT